MKLEGGFPRSALTHLTGGITTSDNIASKDAMAEVRIDNDKLIKQVKSCIALVEMNFMKSLSVLQDQVFGILVILSV